MSASDTNDVVAFVVPGKPVGWGRAGHDGRSQSGSGLILGGKGHFYTKRKFAAEAAGIGILARAALGRRDDETWGRLWHIR